MGTIKIDQDENVLIRKLLNQYILEQENLKTKTEETLEQKGNNAIVIMEINKAKKIIAELDNALKM